MIAFNLQHAVEILHRTPIVLRSLLSGLPKDWIFNNEGPETWSPYDVVGHLIHGERTDWIARMKIILSQSDETFARFDRFAQFKESKGKSLEMLLNEFEDLRTENLKILNTLRINDEKLELTGTHPALGTVTLKHLLATWAAHDLAHLNQITRVMAKNYQAEVGPWAEYITILKE